MRLRERLPSDLARVAALLRAASLPPDGLDRTQGWVLEADGELLGHVALERAPEAVVVRSLAVAEDRRGHGLGAALMAAAEAAQGLPLVLRTDTVAPWMERRGYRRARLADVPAGVRRTTQFSGALCAATPVFIKEAPMAQDPLKSAVRDRYQGFVENNQRCCGPKSTCGCSGDPGAASLHLGYAPEDLAAAPGGANLGLGCGNPVALAALRPGDVVLDLGSGAGFDAFLAAQRVGPSGRVIGVDMTPGMLARARGLAALHGYANVEFLEGDIEALPVPDATADVVISNCVINLTVDKARAFREAFRALKPGGRLMVSDLVLLQALPEAIRHSVDAYAACVAGAMPKADYLEAIRAAGFLDTEVVGESAYDLGEDELAELAGQLIPGSAVSMADLRGAAQSVVSIQVRATRP